jgi:hypothetical protein
MNAARHELLMNHALTCGDKIKIVQHENRTVARLAATRRGARRVK